MAERLSAEGSAHPARLATFLFAGPEPLSTRLTRGCLSRAAARDLLEEMSCYDHDRPPTLSCGVPEQLGGGWLTLLFGRIGGQALIVTYRFEQASTAERACSVAIQLYVHVAALIGEPNIVSQGICDSGDVATWKVHVDGWGSYWSLPEHYVQVRLVREAGEPPELAVSLEVDPRGGSLCPVSE